MIASIASASTLTVAAILFATALGGCAEGEKGACVSTDGPNKYCFEDQDDFACSGSFSANASCSAVGYSHFCTSEQMQASGAEDVYAVERYLDNAACNPAGGSAAAGGTGGSGAAGGASTGQAYTQFYVDPTKFNRELNYLITGIEAEGRTYSPKSSKGSCEDRIRFAGVILEGSPSPRVAFHVMGRSYHSLDTAFGAEYTTVDGYATYYSTDFKPGCNTLEVAESSGSYILTLQLAQ